jgi:hypothetical protein
MTGLQFLTILHCQPDSILAGDQGGPELINPDPMTLFNSKEVVYKE